jgi:hypothetical protein
MLMIVLEPEIVAARSLYRDTSYRAVSDDPGSKVG